MTKHIFSAVVVALCLILSANVLATDSKPIMADGRLDVLTYSADQHPLIQNTCGSFNVTKGGVAQLYADMSAYAYTSPITRTLIVAELWQDNNVIKTWEFPWTDGFPMFTESWAVPSGYSYQARYYFYAWAADGTEDYAVRYSFSYVH